MKVKTLAIISILLIEFQNGYSQKLSELVAINEKSIFQIFSYDEYGSPFSTGTGFFINSNGNALTNLHVIEDAKFAFARDYKGNIYEIDRIVKTCEECDLAEININGQGKPFSYLNLTYNIPLKASDIFVIGNPEGFESTVTKGIISSIRENNQEKVIQISAPISPGSSGSPIMDMKGNVIGVATYQHKSGQNLNFGYWIGCKDKLKKNVNYNLSNSQSRNLYIINEICETESNLVLNSIEINPKNTVLNLSFTNTSLQFGDGAFIFTNVGDKSKSFYIQDKNNGKKRYVYDATIGGSAKAPTVLKLGETKRFKLLFPPIEGSNLIDIKEGMEGPDWSFKNINLEKYRNLDFEDDNFFNDFYFQTGLSFLSSKDYANAYVILKDYATKNNDNSYAHNLAGIISYILGNNLDAFIHINKAIEIDPLSDDYYFNLYYLNKVSENYDKAFKNISSAIQLNDNQPEYYYFRGELYYIKENYKKAIEDFTRIIESDRDVPYHVYFMRGVAKLYEKDRSACNDLEKAYTITSSDAEKETIQQWYSKYCK